jgi:hypothetical protein
MYYPFLSYFYFNFPHPPSNNWPRGNTIARRASTDSNAI